MQQPKTLQFMGVALALAALSGCASPLTSPQAASPAPPTLPATPSQLVGATPDLLNSVFGAPALRRMDGSAQVWLYHSPVCGLNLILYPDSLGTPRVAMAVPDNTDPAACITSLQRSETDAALERLPAS